MFIQWTFSGGEGVELIIGRIFESEICMGEGVIFGTIFSATQRADNFFGNMKFWGKRRLEMCCSNKFLVHLLYSNATFNVKTRSV